MCIRDSNVDYLTFKITDKKVAKRTAIQEQVVWPVRAYNNVQVIEMCIRDRTKGEDGVYFTYTEEHPISFNPFYTDDYYFDVEKKDSIKTLLLTCLLYTSGRRSKTCYRP